MLGTCSDAIKTLQKYQLKVTLLKRKKVITSNFETIINKYFFDEMDPFYA